MIPEPPPGQGPIDPRGAFAPPPPPGAGDGSSPAAAASAGNANTSSASASANAAASASSGPAPAAGASPTAAPAPSAGVASAASGPAPTGPTAPAPQSQPAPAPSSPVAACQQPAGPAYAPPPPNYAPFPPGPMMMPPGPFPFPPPPPPRSGWRTFFFTILLIFFFVSVIFNIVLWLRGGFGSSRSALQADLHEGDAREKIAVIPVGGVIADKTVDSVNRMLNQAEHDPAIRALVLEVDTPGGTVTASDEIYHRILEYRSSHSTVPVIISMGGMATSGGYYLACAGQYVFAQPTTLTGNIGVLMPRYNVKKLASDWGVAETTITAPKVGFKNAGSMFADPKPEETAYLQGLIDHAFARFKHIVDDGRAGKLKQPIEKIADGKVYTASEALALGLVDEIGYLDDAYQKAAQLAGLSRPYVVRYREPSLSLLDLLSSEGRAPIGPGQSTTINGINVNVDGRLFDEFFSPRLLYMWRPGVEVNQPSGARDR